MKFLIRSIIVIAILAGIITAIAVPTMSYLKKRSKPKFRFAETSQGQITEVVNSTGTVKPVRSVSIGAFVSGPITDLFVEFNQEVKEGELLAKIDPRLYDANVARDQANLDSRKADLRRVEALLNQARNNEKRAIALRKVNEEYISDTEMDTYIFNVKSLEAQLDLAKAAISQAQASLDNSQANLSYTEILSPIDGVVIDRKIDPGQTLASTFQTPELFIVAPDLRKEVHIFASVDESDIGLIIDAQKNDLPVEFTVNAYQDELFVGKIAEVRYSSTEVQNVVTYPVVVSTENPDLKLLPGMTATLSFQIKNRENAVRVPNAALRFYPKPEHVHPDDRKILDGIPQAPDPDNQESSDMSASQLAEAKQNRRRRHVWKLEGDLLRAVEVTVGISDNKYSELIEGDLKANEKLVTGLDNG